MLTRRIGDAGVAVGIDAQRDLLRGDQTILTDIGRHMDFIGIGRADCTLPVGLLLAIARIIIDAWRRKAWELDTEWHTARRQWHSQNAQHDQIRPPRWPDVQLRNWQHWHHSPAGGSYT